MPRHNQNGNGTEHSNQNNPRRGDAGVIRSGSHGRMLREPPQPAPNVEGYRKASSGRFVGFDLVDPGLERRDSGQLRNVRDEQQLSRRELQARYGHHNTGERNFDEMVDEPGRVDDTPSVGEVFSAVQEISTRAAAADISLSPEEATSGVGAVGRSALGGFNLNVGGETAPSAPIDDAPPDIQRGEDPFDITSGGVGDSVELFGGGSANRQQSGQTREGPEPERFHTTEIEFGGEVVDITERDREDLETFDKMLSRNVDAEVEAQRARGGTRPSELAQDFAQRQAAVSAEIQFRREMDQFGGR